MTRRMLLLACAVSLAAGPALALDSTEAVTADPRLRSVRYDPQQVVMVYTKPGMTTRIRLDPREHVVHGGVIYSDQRTMAALDGTDPYDEEDRKQEAQAGQASGAQGTQSCNRNMCVSVVLNTVYILPRIQLAPQPFFLRTEWCPEAGKACEPGEYAIELRSEPPEARSGVAQPFFGVQFTYADRERAWAAKQAAAKRAADAEAARLWRENNPPPQPVSVPAEEDRYELGVCRSGSELHPDEAWTNGRTTFLRYRGTRPTPNVYEIRLDGKETLTPFAMEPEPWGTVIRVGTVRPVLILRHGDLASCVVNISPIADGHGTMPVAPIRTPWAGRPRVAAR
ncbi:TrbG/VirB9 family P-type conjugative transfer protein [Paracraurococcus lichenis]|uniref:TrbG/VirB9 family P-type conjugative transfer protein n=1 Tax=Paracraurococcus lichenis TaxID=3064888 RepID=A0ABT9E8M3_9PROT|nr:TrbG/VirB9 family P-type conjugative transfer protein [Paracraurococcus sp. LOR1-02]MDO9712551.1 TrbG/VirB9 family P-type conjugative transfer protein [Paracraurococcus sp. LOR1-02]